MSTFTIEECKRWLSSPFINPRTGETLDDLSKNGIFGILQKQAQAYNLMKETKTQTSKIHKAIEIPSKEVSTLPLKPLLKPLQAIAKPKISASIQESTNASITTVRPVTVPSMVPSMVLPTVTPTVISAPLPATINVPKILSVKSNNLARNAVTTVEQIPKKEQDTLQAQPKTQIIMPIVKPTGALQTDESIRTQSSSGFLKGVGPEPKQLPRPLLPILPKKILPIVQRLAEKPTSVITSSNDTASAVKIQDSGDALVNKNNQKKAIIIEKKRSNESNDDADNEDEERYDSTLAARNYIKLLESEAYIEDFRPDEETGDNSNDPRLEQMTVKNTQEDQKKDSHSSEEEPNHIAEVPKRRGRPPKAKIPKEVDEKQTTNTDNDNEVTPISKHIVKPRLAKKNKRIRYYMYSGISEDSQNPSNNGIIPIINSNWVELIETLGKEIYLLESLNKHRISIIEVISDKIDFKDFVRFPEISKAEQVAKNTGDYSEYDYLSENFIIPSLTAYMGNRTYDTHESRMLLEFLTTLEDVMVDLGNIVLDIEKKPRGRKKGKTLQQDPEVLLGDANGIRIEPTLEIEEVDIMRLDLDPGCLSISQLIQRVDRLLKPLLTTRMIWEEKYAEYYIDDDWFYIDFYKMVEDLSVKEFKDLVQRTYKKRVPDTWLSEQYRDTEDIEEFLAHLEVTIDELYGSDIAQEGSDDYEGRLANIITEFTRIKKA